MWKDLPHEDCRMDAHPEKSKNHRGRWIFLVIALIILFILAASYGLRSSIYLTSRIGPKLQEVGDKLNGRFSFAQIHAIGITGILLKDVEFRPNTPNTHPIHFNTMTVYPAMLGMFFGDLNASLVEIQGMNGSFDFSTKDTPDIEWLRGVSESFSQNVSDLKASRSDSLNGASQHRDIPVLACNHCQIGIDLPDAQRLELSIEQQTAEIATVPTTGIQLTGTPVSVCLAGHTPCFEMQLSTVRPGENIAVSGLQIKNLDYKGIRLNHLSVGTMEIAHNETRTAVLIDNGQIDSHISDVSSLSMISGEYRFDFVQLEILYEKAAKRIGMGIGMHEPNGASARIFGGYQLDTQKLALTLDTSDFDFARFTRMADFSKYLRLNAFPVSGHINAIIEIPQKRSYFNIDASVTNGSVYSEMLARNDMTNINAKLETNAWLDLAEKTFAIENAHGNLNKIPFRAEVFRQKTYTGSYHFEASLESAGASDDFIPSLPTGFAPNLDGYKLTGPYSFRLATSFEDDDLDHLVLDADFNLDEVQTLQYDPHSDFDRLNGDAFMIRINAATVPIQIGPRDPDWVSFYDLPRETAYAFVASEDGKFFTHAGFDIRAIRASLIADLKAEKVVRGGSTISQQVVKNLFLNQDKTASRKFQEAFLTWQMEKKLTKRRIFEFYLNLAHWAKDTYGIRAAAQFYFQKPVSQLTLRESLFLVSILPNPIIFGKQYADNKLSSSRLNKMINVGNALRAANRVSAADWEAAIPLIREGKISDKPRPHIE